MESSNAKRFWQRTRHWLRLDALSPRARRILVAIIGGIVLLVGVAMLVLPGPAIIVIPFGLAILGTEFEWARRSVRKVRQLFRQGRMAITGK